MAAFTPEGVVSCDPGLLFYLSKGHNDMSLFAIPLYLFRRIEQFTSVLSD